MELTILQTHLTFSNNVLIGVAVLWSKFDEIRASYSDNKQSSGYHYLKSYAIPTMTLFSEVASSGRCLTNTEKKQYFPKQKL
jgi:hypothetical protein